MKYDESPVETVAASTGEPSATQRAYQVIRQLIITGELSPGHKLKIEDLRALVNSGASPVREALRRIPEYLAGTPESPEQIERRASSGSISCAIGPGGGGCLAVIVEDPSVGEALGALLTSIDASGLVVV